VREQLSARAERILPGLLGFTVFAFACGSSVVDLFELVGRPLRWASLVALAAASVALAVGARPPTRRLRLAAIGAASLVCLAAVSAAWSVDPRVSSGRAGSLGVLLLAAAALAAGAAGRPELIRRLLTAILAAAVVVAAAGLVVLALVHGSAVQAASDQYGARYRGMGQNPNTVAALFCVALPLAAWQVWERRTRWARLAALAAFALLEGSIVASGSRGALLSGAVALVVFGSLAARSARTRGTLLAGVAALTVVSVGLAQIPNAEQSGRTAPPPQTRNAERILPLDREIGRGDPSAPAPGIKRRLLGGSGRAVAWRGALDRAAERPLAGYGFGTEEQVFVDRYYYFAAGAPENSYLGVLLQLGVAGLACLVALALGLLAAGVAAARGLAGAPRRAAAAAAAALAGGLALALTQSYLVSVGNVATASVWISGFLALAGRAGRTA